MIRTERQGLKYLLKISSPFVLFSTAYAVLVMLVEEALGDHVYKISGEAGSVFGLALAFFLGFRMNSAYDRWWEARKIFGELTNTSRAFVAKIFVYYENPQNFRNQPSVSRADELMRLTISYITQLKNEMHDRDKPDIDEETEKLFAKYNIDGNAKISNELLIAIAAGIEHDFESQTSLEKADLMQQINRFYDIQGKAERIKNTPFLMIYSAFTRIIVGFYVALIPIFVGDIDLGGEESKFEFLAIPIMVVISTVFLTINKLANLYGEPFSEKRTAVAIDDICRTIEKNYQEVRRKWNNRSAPAQ